MNSTSTLDLNPIVIAGDMPRYRAAYDELTNDAMSIQTQLANKDRIGPDGVRMDDRAYHHWRHRALQALNVKNRQKRALKAALQEAEPLARAAGTVAPVVITDLRGFSHCADPLIAELMRKVRDLQATIPDDADFADLAGCLLENLDELRGRLEGWAS